MESLRTILREHLLEKHVSGGTPVPKPDALKSKLSEVGLAKDDKGYYVYTHRARSKSYASPEKIPDKDITFIASTG